MWAGLCRPAEQIGKLSCSPKLTQLGCQIRMLNGQPIDIGGLPLANLFRKLVQQASQDVITIGDRFQLWVAVHEFF